MHRSGTSAFAGVAVKLGFSPPRTPLPAADDNPGGFYESLPAVMVNHSLLLAAGCAWNFCLAFDPDRLSRLPDEIRAYIPKVLADEFGGGPGFVLKDPRLCLTLPAWLPALRESGLHLTALIVVRHPAEVVASLLSRNKLPADETAPHWLHHTLEAERASRGMDRAVVFYDDLMRDWRGCLHQASRSARIAWPTPVETAQNEIDGFLAGAMRHHRLAQAGADVGPAPVCDMVNAVWTAMRRLADDPESPFPLVCFDTVRRSFADWRRAHSASHGRAVFPSVRHGTAYVPGT
jgi:hypothetical protein